MKKARSFLVVIGALALITFVLVAGVLAAAQKKAPVVVVAARALEAGTKLSLALILDEITPGETMWLTPYVFPGLYCLLAGMATTGAITRWFRDQFCRQEMAAEAAGGPSAYAALTAEAQAVPPGSEGLVILPYFGGERTPLNDPDARGVIAGLSLAHGRGHIYRAILEATAYGVLHNLEVMRTGGANPHRAIAAGGGTKSDSLCPKQKAMV